MAIGERIHFFRNKSGMTQKYLGQRLGFPKQSADVRLAQYETGTRTPKTDLTNRLADELGVSPNALTVPDIDSYIGLMHTLFALEDIYGLKINDIDGTVCLTVDVFKSSESRNLNEMLRTWQQTALKLKNGEITQEEYDRWRYHYPEFDTSSQWHKITPSRESSDILNFKKLIPD